MANLKIEIGFKGIEKLMALAMGDVAELFPNQLQTMNGLALMAQKKWIKYAQGQEKLPSGHTLRAVSGTYAKSIKMERTNTGYRVFSDDPKAHIIEEGASAWDYKQVLRTSHKARKGRDGSLYLIIPFRHGTPDSIGLASMPEDVYELMVQKPQSLITGTYETLSVQDAKTKVGRRAYSWGGRLTGKELEGMGYDTSQQNIKNLAGMVRMSTTGGGRVTSSNYITFRVVSEKSPKGSWIIPEREGQHVTQAVVTWLGAKSEEIMKKAKELDVQRFIEIMES